MQVAINKKTSDYRGTYNKPGNISHYSELGRVIGDSRRRDNGGAGRADGAGRRNSGHDVGRLVGGGRIDGAGRRNFGHDVGRRVGGEAGNGGDGGGLGTEE